jgi:putative DNA-invertase from lambdoid prophage Rac
MSRVFAYTRVSTAEQTPENQVQEIAAAGFAVTEQRCVQETISGSTQAAARPGFMRLLDRMETGDVLVVTKLDRLGRNAMDVRATVEKLAAMGVKVHCLALGGADLTSAAGRLTMGVIAAVAEFERDLLVERTKSGLKRAVSAGAVIGRPASLTSNQVSEALSLRASGKSVSEIARHFAVSRACVQRLLRRTKTASGRALSA